MKAVATAKFVGTSARKTGLVAALIRGRRAADARVILQNTNKRATDPVGLVLASAMANAVANHGMKSEELTVESVLIGPGPTAKRMRPRARGSAARIRKHSSHITVVLSDGRAEVVEAPVSPAAEEVKQTEAAPKPKAEKTEKAEPKAQDKPRTRAKAAEKEEKE